MKSIFFLLVAILFISCNRNEAVQIGENTFVHNSKIYKLIDNELTEIGDLKSDSIRTLGVLKPIKKELGEVTLDYVKPGASARVDALYRGNFLYFKLTIKDLKDLRDNYSNGQFTIDFQDEFGFNLHSIEVPKHFLTALVDDNNEILQFEFKGKTEMSTEINSAIKDISVTSSVRKKNNYEY